MHSLYKNHLQAHFDRASSTYESVAHVQKKAAHHLVNLLQQHLPTFYPSSILDVGTGTGYLPQILLSLFPKSHYHLNDLSSQMLSQAQKKLGQHANLSFILGDIENIPLTHHSLIISNFALQWASHLTSVLTNLYHHANAIAFTCLLENTFAEWTSLFTDYALPNPSYAYPTEALLIQYLKSLNPHYFYSETHTFPLHFPSKLAFARYLQKLGANQSSSTLSRAKIKRLLTHDASPFHTSYHVYFAILKGS